jgi:molybdate transport system substrate-binding protein
MLCAKRSALTIAFFAFMTACSVSHRPQPSSTNSTDPASSGNTPAVTLTVGAAADLNYAFQELGAIYEAETGTKIDFNFGSTGQLAQQVDRGAPIDLFAAANQSFVEDLDAKGRVISDTKEIYGRGRIVLWSRNDSPLEIEQLSLEDLLDPEITRVAIANPAHAPYGIAAREALEAVGVWEQIQPKLVLGENVRQTLQYAETGNVDVAIVALSLAVVADGQWQLLPEELHNPLDQMLAVVEGTPHETEARDFAEFINSAKGRPIMQQYGFVLPTEEPVQ